jgi:lysozyme family protein
MPSIIDDVLKREGKPTNDPRDAGGRTAYGLSERANPDLWATGAPTEEQARARYQQRYIDQPGFAKVADLALRAFLIDYGVMSGPALAIQRLQEVLGVAQDGILGPQTLTALTTQRPAAILNLLIDRRIPALVRIVERDPSQLAFLRGWITRTLSFRAL